MAAFACIVSGHFPQKPYFDRNDKNAERRCLDVSGNVWTPSALLLTLRPKDIWSVWPRKVDFNAPDEGEGSNDITTSTDVPDPKIPKEHSALPFSHAL